VINFVSCKALGERRRQEKVRKEGAENIKKKKKTWKKKKHVRQISIERGMP